MLIYNNSTSSVSLVYNLSYNVISLIYLSNNFLFPSNYEISISIDFIKKLLSSSGFDTILIIVNQLTKQPIFIPAHDTIMSANLVCLFILYVFSKHVISFHVTSNRGLEFVSKFFHSLDTALNI